MYFIKNINKDDIEFAQKKCYEENGLYIFFYKNIYIFFK